MLIGKGDAAVRSGRNVEAEEWKWAMRNDMLSVCLSVCLTPANDFLFWDDLLHQNDANLTFDLSTLKVVRKCTWCDLSKCYGQTHDKQTGYIRNGPSTRWPMKLATNWQVLTHNMATKSSFDELLKFINWKIERFRFTSERTGRNELKRFNFIRVSVRRAGALSKLLNTRRLISLKRRCAPRYWTVIMSSSVWQLLGESYWPTRRCLMIDSCSYEVLDSCTAVWFSIKRSSSCSWLSCPLDKTGATPTRRGSSWTDNNRIKLYVYVLSRA